MATANYLFRFDTTTWGWIHLVLGLVIIAFDVLVIWALAGHGDVMKSDAY